MPLIVAVAASAIPAVMLFKALDEFGRVNDLPNYYAAAWSVVNRRADDIYDVKRLGQTEHALFPSMGERVIRFHIAPPGIPWLLPVVAFPPAPAPYMWIVVLLAGLVFSVWLCVVIFNLSFQQALIMWAVLVVSGPAYESLRIGQLAPLILLAFLLFTLALKRGRTLLAALALSYLLVKPQLLIPPVVYLVGAGRYMLLVQVAVIVAAFSAASLILVGFGPWQDYVKMISGSVEYSCYLQPELTPSVRGQLLRLLPELPRFVSTAGAVLWLSGMGLLFWIGRRFRISSLWLEAGLLSIFPVGLALGLHNHDYDLLLLLPTLAVLAKMKLNDGLPEWARLVLMLSGLFFLLPFYLFVHYSYLLQGGLWNPLAIVLILFVVYVLMTLCRNKQEFA